MGPLPYVKRKWPSSAGLTVLTAQRVTYSVASMSLALTLNVVLLAGIFTPRGLTVTGNLLYLVRVDPNPAQPLTNH